MNTLVAEAQSAKTKAENVVAGWIRESNNPGALAADQRSLNDLVDLVALQAHNGESLIVLTTQGSSNPLDGAWLDDMLVNGPMGQGMSANWLIQAVYAQGRILVSASGGSVLDVLVQAAAQLEAASRERRVWSKRNEDQFASLRRVVDTYIHQPRENARQKLATQPRNVLAKSLHSLMDPDVQPVGFARPALVPAAPITPIRRSWFARVRDAITHPSNKELTS